MKRIPSPEKFWSSKQTAPTAIKNLDLILASAVSLPLTFWREQFLFTQAKDNLLLEQTSGRFPAKLVPGKTHPVFALEPITGGIGFRVCPCSSKIPRDHARYRFIHKGCCLKFSGIVTDRNSYILHWLFFNIPKEMAIRLRFQGEVPEICLSGEKECLKE